MPVKPAWNLVPGGQPDVTGAAQPQPIADRRALDGGDDRGRAVVQPEQPVVHFLAVVGAEAVTGESLEVAAGAEGGAFSREDHRPDPAVLANLFHGLDEAFGK